MHKKIRQQRHSTSDKSETWNNSMDKKTMLALNNVNIYIKNTTKYIKVTVLAVLIKGL